MVFKLKVTVLEFAVKITLPPAQRVSGSERTVNSEHVNAYRSTNRRGVLSWIYHLK